ncbi:MAG TPA: hypothetical protein VGS11_12380 [Candidatus Bathyarchaeia archaeon]|nr:hypothetical protein [Candidatus Bathyarchaeia archaeon]
MRISLVILIFMALVIPISPARVAGQTLSTTQASLVGFNLSVTPSTFNIHNGTSANGAILVTSQGLTGPVSLTASVSPSSGVQAIADPSTIAVLPGGNAASTLEINATSAQLGEYKINVTGSAPLAASQSLIVTVQVTGAQGPPQSPPSGSPNPQGPSGSNNNQPSMTTSGSNPKGPSTPKGQGSQTVFDPVGIIVAGNVIAAIGTIGAIASMYRKKNNPRIRL